MTAIDFPNSPSINQTFTVGDRTWKWTGTTWDAEVTLQVVGPQGPQGEIGPQGPQGEAGISPVVAYTHTQNAVSYIWSITHNLEFYPNVTTTDASGFSIDGLVAYIDTNSLTVTFSIATTGFAYLS